MNTIKRLSQVLIAASALLAPCLAIASGGAGGEHHTNWVFVGSLLFNFIAFVILLFVLLKKPVASFFESRSKEIADTLSAADKAREAAEAKIKEYGDKIDELMSTTDEVMNKAKAEAEYEKDRIISNAKAEAKKVIDDAGKIIETEFEMARTKIVGEAMKDIVEKAEEMLEKSISQDDHARMADDYIDMLREVKRQ